MPTENRSSNTEMVKVPRELADRIQLRINHAALHSKPQNLCGACSSPSHR